MSAAAAALRCSGAGMLLGADAAGRTCGCWLLLQRGGASAPHSSVPPSAALRKAAERGTDRIKEASLTLFSSSLPLPLTPHLVLPLPSPQPTSSSLYDPSQSPHPPTSPFPSSATSSSFPIKTLMHLYRVRRSEKRCSRQAQETMQTLHVGYPVPGALRATRALRAECDNNDPRLRVSVETWTTKMRVVQQYRC